MDESNNKKSIGMLIMILALVLVAVILVIVIVASSGESETTTGTPTGSSTPAISSSTGPEGTGPEGTGTGPKDTDFTPVPVTPSTGTADDSGKITVSANDVKTGLLLNITTDSKYDTTVNKLFTGTATTPAVEDGFSRISTKFKSIDYSHFLRTEALDALEAMVQAFDSVAGTDKPFRVEGYTAATADVTEASSTGYVFKIRIMTADGTLPLNYSSKKVSLNGTQVTYDKWFEAYCAAYGFVFEGLVGGDNTKAGQFRYVGPIHAAGITKEGSLSAYIAGIKDGSIKSVTVNGETWNLSYTKVAVGDSATTEITVGKNATYTISGDNNEGVIVAVKAAQ